MITPKTLKILKKAGWTPSRRIDVADCLERFRSNGFVVSEATSRFCANFGDLSIVYQYGAHNWTDGIDFDLWAWSEADPDIAQLYSDYAGEALCPVGASDRNLYVLYLGASGALYIVEEGCLCRLGTDALSGLDTLITGSEMECLLEPPMR